MEARVPPSLPASSSIHASRTPARDEFVKLPVRYLVTVDKKFVQTRHSQSAHPPDVQVQRSRGNTDHARRRQAVGLELKSVNVLGPSNLNGFESCSAQSEPQRPCGNSVPFYRRRS